MQISGTKETKINAGYYAPPNHKRPTDVSADLKTFLQICIGTFKNGFMGEKKLKHTSNDGWKRELAT